MTCKDCKGTGKKWYSNTSTWRKGVGGERMTEDVCDKCWGSGDEEHPNPSLKDEDSGVVQR